MHNSCRDSCRECEKVSVARTFYRGSPVVSIRFKTKIRIRLTSQTCNREFKRGIECSCIIGNTSRTNESCPFCLSRYAPIDWTRATGTIHSTPNSTKRIIWGISPISTYYKVSMTRNICRTGCSGGSTSGNLVAIRESSPLIKPSVRRRIIVRSCNIGSSKITFEPTFSICSKHGLVHISIWRTTGDGGSTADENL